MRPLLGILGVVLLCTGCTTSSATRREEPEEDLSDPEAYRRHLERQRRKLMTPEEIAEEDVKKARENLQLSDIVAFSFTEFGKTPPEYCPWSETSLVLHAKTRSGVVLRLMADELSGWNPTLDTSPALRSGSDLLTLAAPLEGKLAEPADAVTVTLSFEGSKLVTRETLKPDWRCFSGALFTGEAGQMGSRGAEGSPSAKRREAGTGEAGGDGSPGGDAEPISAEAAFVLDSKNRRYLLLVAEGKSGKKEWGITIAGKTVTVYGNGGRGGSGGAGGRGGPIGACPVGRAGSGGSGGHGARGGAGSTVTLSTATPQVVPWVEVRNEGGDGGFAGDSGDSGRTSIRCDDDVEREGAPGSLGSRGRVGPVGAAGRLVTKQVPAAKLKLVTTLLAEGSGYRLDPDQSAPPRP